MVGQDRVKSDLSFRLDGYNASGFFPPTLLEGPRGFGKTDFMLSILARLTSRHGLTKEDGTPAPKPYKVINGATLKKISSFVDAVIIPFQGAECTIAIDEVHAADPKVLDWLLSVISPNKERRSIAMFDGAEFEFDHRMQTFIFATTNSEKLKEPFKSRCNRVSFENYKIEEIAEIVRRVAKDEICFKEDTELEIAKISRFTPREAVKRAQDAISFANILGKDDFTLADMDSFRRRLKIRPLGLSSLEYQYLETLGAHGAMTLTAVSNALRLDPTTVRRDVERFLMEIHAIRIDGTRALTGAGKEILDACKGV